MKSGSELDRRRLIKAFTLGGTGLLLGGCAVMRRLPLAAKEGEEGEISPAEDLMREHGILRRVFLIYEEIITKIERDSKISAAPVQTAAQIVRTFIEDYHERLEEDYLFPWFQAANKSPETITSLVRQHKAGRVITDRILETANSKSLRVPAKRTRMVSLMREFVRMYRPHAAREDTEIFPKIREVVPPHDYAPLGETFENKEQQLFGKDGFSKMVAKVEAIERDLGISDLSRFTPKL